MVAIQFVIKCAFFKNLFLKAGLQPPMKAAVFRKVLKIDDKYFCVRCVEVYVNKLTKSIFYKKFC